MFAKNGFYRTNNKNSPTGQFSLPDRVDRFGIRIIFSLDRPLLISSLAQQSSFATSAPAQLSASGCYSFILQFVPIRKITTQKEKE
ncbi:Hypothetical protein NTJ_14382 [Nesidiocoris tenuis]|uniref:Uncharacterized protein n=1 Tax=Nesidiocoris tenuis TaxID=355587 RepID=A0ABN7BD10_9HEMI|nr:Hypothetical protein NTJ_14382 [Nesidiocoris tenuis]